MSTVLPRSQSKDAYHPRRPTASQILEEQNITDWKDKVVLITGATSGIGIETAKAFAQIGAQLILPVRNQEKAQAVIEDIKKAAGEENTRITLLPLDLESLQSVRNCAAEFLALNLPLNVLICNAGVMAVPQHMRTKDGFDYQFGINHLAHFLLFELLKEKLLASSTPQFNSRVVTLSSAGHRTANIFWDDLQFDKHYNEWDAYGQSKTANILMAREIEKRYGAQGLHANAVHPGNILTNLGQYVDPASLKEVLEKYKFSPDSIKTAEEGAATTVWAATSQQFEGKGGFYLEDVSYTFENEEQLSLDGHRAYAYDEESAARLWDISLKLTGLSQ